MDSGWETVVPFGAAVSVSTLTTLIDFVNYGSDYRKLLFTVHNPSAVNNVTIFVEASETGTSPDVTTRWVNAGPPQSGGTDPSIPILDVAHRYYRLSAQTDSPSFPTVSVTYEVRGLHRKTP